MNRFRVRHESTVEVFGLTLPVVQVRYLDLTTARQLPAAELRRARAEYERLASPTPGFRAPTGPVTSALRLVDQVLAEREMPTTANG